MILNINLEKALAKIPKYDAKFIKDEIENLAKGPSIVNQKFWEYF